MASDEYSVYECQEITSSTNGAFFFMIKKNAPFVELDHELTNIG